MNAIRDMRGGRKSDSRFSSRMIGQGARWAAIERLFAMQCDRLGLNHLEGEVPVVPESRRPARSPQIPLSF